MVYSLDPDRAAAAASVTRTLVGAHLAEHRRVSRELPPLTTGGASAGTIPTPPAAGREYPGTPLDKTLRGIVAPSALPKPIRSE